MRTIETDILVIGSGAAGGVFAGTLTELLPGKSLVIAEKGGWYGAEFFNQREWDTLVTYADRGRRMTADGAMPVKSGECVGGGTTINVGFCIDPPPEVWDGWRRDYGLEQFSFSREANDYGVPGLNITTAVDEVKKRLSIAIPGDGDLNENNLTFQRACEAAGYETARFPRNALDCAGCGFCTEGCAYDRKQSCDMTYIPDAVARGARLIHSFNIERIVFEKKNGALQATGAVGRVRTPDEGSRPNSVEAGALRVNAKLVILAAGAIADPVLLVRSEHPDPHGVIGRGIILHPSLPVAGLMDREIIGYRGIPGVVYSDHFGKSHGFYLECLFGHPVYGSVIFPLIGAEHFEVMKQFGKIAGFGVMLVDTMNLANRVEVTPATMRIHYQLDAADRERFQFAAERAVDLMFQAGAREVMLPSDEPLGPLPVPRFTKREQAVYARELQFVPHRTTITSAHCQATVKMSEDPRLGVVDSRCESHAVKNLVVCDASSFPTSCGVNPMLAIFALAQYQARRIAAEWNRYAA